MERPPRHSPASIAELLATIAGKSFTVQWVVRTEIGPEWIGGGREIHFSVDGQLLDEACPVYAVLRDALIARLGVPESADDACIDGEGEISIFGNILRIDYDVHTAVPYMDGSSEGGTTTLLELGPSE